MADSHYANKNVSRFQLKLNVFEIHKPEVRVLQVRLLLVVVDEEAECDGGDDGHRRHPRSRCRLPRRQST